MSEAQLRLGASFKDEATPGIRKLKREIAEARKTPAMQELTKWFDEVGTGAGKFAASAGNVPGIINAMGIGSLTAAASVAELVRNFAELSRHQLAMKELGREVGMTTDQMNAFAHAGAHFGVSGDGMSKMVENMARQMPEFRRNMGPMFEQLSQFKGLINELQHEGTEDQLKSLFKFFGDNPKLQAEPQLRKQMMESIFGNADDAEKLMAENFGGIMREWNKAKKDLDPISPEMLEAEKKYRDAVESMNRTLENFENKVGPGFLKMLTHIADDIRFLFGGIEKQEQKALDKKDDDRRKQVLELRDRARGEQRRGGAEDERKRIEGSGLSLDDPRVQDALRKKSSYSGSGYGGLLQRTAYVTGDGGSPIAGMMADATKQGFLAAFRELMAEGGGDPDPKKPGLIKASYGDPGSGGYGAGTSGRGMGNGGSRGDAGGDYPESSSAGNLTKLIDEAARKAGIDPRIMEGIRAGESLHSNRYDKKDDAIESSWGPFQLNRRRGLGVQFEHDTGLDLRNPSSIPAQADWVARYLAHGGSLRAWSGYHGMRNADPRWGDSGYIPQSSASSGSAASAVDKGMALLGRSGGEVGKAFGVHITPGEWCAEFVNGALKASGIKGTNSAMAGSFRNWGHAIASGAVKKGDVVVDGDPAGHVSLATGATRMKNGHLQIETLNGNWGHSHGQSAVKKDWLTAQDWVHVRRADGLPAPAAPSQQVAEGGKGRVDVHIHDPGGHVRHHSSRSDGSLDVHVQRLNRYDATRGPLLST